MEKGGEEKLSPSPETQMGIIKEKLRDLKEFGISLDHRKGTCDFCGGEIDPEYSPGLALGSSCRQCRKKAEELWRPETAYVTRKEGGPGKPPEYKAIIKISGDLYEVGGLAGDWGILSPLDEEERRKWKKSRKYVIVRLGFYDAERIWKKQEEL